jgi:hypothetical protein
VNTPNDNAANKAEAAGVISCRIASARYFTSGIFREFVGELYALATSMCVSREYDYVSEQIDSPEHSVVQETRIRLLRAAVCDINRRLTTAKPESEREVKKHKLKISLPVLSISLCLLGQFVTTSGVRSSSGLPPAPNRDLALKTFGQSSAPYKNPSLPIEKRVDDLVSRMTLEEKVSQMIDAAPALFGD